MTFEIGSKLFAVGECMPISELKKVALKQTLFQKSSFEWIFITGFWQNIVNARRFSCERI